MPRRRRSRGRNWFVVGAAVVVLALLGITAAAIVDATTSEDGPEERRGEVVTPETAGAAPGDADVVAERAREFYRHLVERRLSEAVALATGDARTQVEALEAARAQDTGQDPVLAQIVDESARGRLDAFEVVEPPHGTGSDAMELTARAVVDFAGKPSNVEVWFALRREAAGWRVHRFRPRRGQ